MPANAFKFLGHTPVIRKLISQGSSFSCSLCRSSYENRSEALSCLSSCWEELGHRHPVHVNHHLGQKTLYRCQYCSRDYETDPEALSCAQQCRERINILHERELQAISIRPSTRRPRPILRTPRLAHPAQPAARFKDKAGAAPLASPAPTSSGSTAASASAESVAAAAPEAAEAPRSEKATPAKGRNKRSFAKPWVRHDAKYKCSFCNALYFTKLETEKCFDGHFDAEGFEILPP